MAFSLPFWLQGRDHIWQRGCESLPGHELVVDMRRVVFFHNFWWFWVWRPGLTEKQLRNIRRFTGWKPAGE